MIYHHFINYTFTQVAGYHMFTTKTKGCSHEQYVASLTHWGRATHICVSKLNIIGSDNGLSPDWRQAIIWTNAGILLIEPVGTNKLLWNLSRNSHIFIQENVFENVVWKIAAILSRPQFVNSLAPGRYSCSNKLMIFKLISRIDIWHNTSMIQVMVLFHQPTSLYLN